MRRFRMRSLIAAFPLVLLLAAGGPSAIDLRDTRLFPESLSITPDGTAYVGSMSGGVLRVSLESGTVTRWIAPGSYGTGSLFGVLADPRNRMLWVCSNDFSAIGLKIARTDTGSLLKGFDLHTGAGRVSLRLPGDKAMCNDMAVAKDGSVLVTDTGASQVLRWRPGADALEVWASDPIFESARGGGLDGIAFGGDGNLYLTNLYSGQLYRVAVGHDGKAGKVTKLALSRPLAAPDAIRPIGGMAFALVEGEGRIDRLIVSGDRAELRTLAEGVTEPTGVDGYGRSLWYLEGQLSYVFNAEKRALTPDRPFVLTRVALDR